MEKRRWFGYAWLVALLLAALLVNAVPSLAEDEQSSTQETKVVSNTTLEEATAAVEAAKTAYDAAVADAEAKKTAYDAAVAATATAKTAYDAAVADEAAKKTPYDEAAAATATAKTAYDAAVADEAAKKTPYDEAAAAAATAKTAYDTAAADEAAKKTAYEDAQKATADANSAYDAAKTATVNAQSAYDAAVTATETAKTASETAASTASDKKDAYDAAAKSASDAKAEYDNATADRQAAEDELKKYTEGTDEYNEAKAAYDSAVEAEKDKKTAYESAQSAADKALSDYNEAQEAANDAEAAYADAQADQAAKKTALDSAVADEAQKKSAAEAAPGVEAEKKKAYEDAQPVTAAAKTAYDAAAADEAAKKVPYDAAVAATAEAKTTYDTAAADEAEKKTAYDTAVAATAAAKTTYDAAVADEAEKKTAYETAQAAVDAAKQTYDEALATKEAIEKQRTITFDTQGGSAVDPITAAIGTALTAPTDPTLAGFVFLGWDPAFPATMPEENLTLKAVWKATITAIDPLTDINITYKPELTAALAMMPTSVGVTLSDGTTTTAALTWTADSCPTYDAKSGDRTYVFTAAALTTEGEYALGDKVKLPTCNLVVAPGTYSDQYGDYTYRVYADGLLTVESVTTKQAEVVVPQAMNGIQVSGLAASLFRKNDTVTRVDLPAGLISIGERCFENCTALASLTLPDSLQAVGADMLKNDAALTHVILRASLESTLTAQDTVAHTVKADQEETTYTVALPVSISDILVDTGKLTVDADFVVNADCAISVNPEGTVAVAADRTLRNLGAVANNGAVSYNGTIITCGGTWTGNAPEQKKGGALVTDHVYVGGVCTGCGAEEPVVVTELTITYSGSGLDKVYDKTRNVTVTGADFKIKGKRSGHENVRITGIRAAYDSADVGDRKVSISFTLGGDDVNWYTCSDITVEAKITAKPLIITPTEDQKKFYGAADPTYFTGKVKGLLSGDTITGRLSRESGENVGKYKILQGTIDAGTNYEIEVEEEYFTIEAKSINSTDVGLVTIGNQRYTGQPIKPEITMRYGTLTLKQNTDFKAEYSDNTKAGTAKVKLTGIGNYTGERETTFRILEVPGGGGSGGGGGGGGGGYGDDWDDDDDDDDDDFDDGSEEFEDEFDDEDEEDEDIGRLIIDDVDYGEVMLDDSGNPYSFIVFDEEGSDGERVLTIVPDPLMNPETGVEEYLEDNVRERYGTTHLRISPTLAQTLMEQGYSEILFQMEQADVRIPLEALVEELPLDVPNLGADDSGIEQTADDTPAEGEEVTFNAAGGGASEKLPLVWSEVASNDAAEPVDAENGEINDEEVAPQALHVSAYDICLEQADAIRMTIAEARAQAEADGVEFPTLPEPAAQGETGEAVDFDAPAADAGTDPDAEGPDPEVMALLLKERELAQLEEYTLMAPAYRLSVRVILEGQEPEPTGLVDENGEDVLGLIPQELPEGVYPLNIRLLLTPDYDVDEEMQLDAQSIRVTLLDSPEDPDDAELQPADFEELDGMVYAVYQLSRDGLYALNGPDLATIEEMEDGGSEDNFEDADYTDDGFEG